ncbi:MAG: glycosyltransferase family 92 protein [Chloroflexota bacterium]
MDYLSLCLICKDENDYLPEWLDYHILMGVERFYIYDNESRVSLRQTLKEYIELGWVVVMDIPGKAMQLQAYDHCLQTFGPNSFWMGFIDTDEFLVPKTVLDLKELLKKYEAYGGLAVSSLFFGSSGQQTRPAEGQIAGYTKSTHATFIENELIKSIVRPSMILSPKTPHDFFYKPAAHCVNESFLRVDNQHFPHSAKKIQLNHYFCRSRAELEQKLIRGRGDAVELYQRKRFDWVDRYATFSETTALQNLQEVLGLSGQKNASMRKKLAQGELLRLAAGQARNIKPQGQLFDVPTRLVLREAMTRELVMKAHLNELLKEENYLELKKLYLEMQKELPEQIALYIDLVTILINLNEPELAWQALAQAWKLAPNSYYVLNSMSNFFLRASNFEMAEKTVRLLLNIAPLDLQAQAFLTEALLGQGRFEDALKIGVPVIELSAEVGELPKKMGLYLVKKMADYLSLKQDYAGAIHLWQTGLKCQPEDVDALLEYSQVLLVTGNNAGAQQQLTKARLLAPQNETVLAMLKRVSVASTVSKRRRH